MSFQRVQARVFVSHAVLSDIWSQPTDLAFRSHFCHSSARGPAPGATRRFIGRPNSSAHLLSHSPAMRAASGNQAAWCCVSFLLLCWMALATAREPMSEVCPKHLATEAKRRDCHKRTADTFNALAMLKDSTLAFKIANSIIGDAIVWRTDPVGLFAGKDMAAEYVSILSSPTGPATVVSCQQVTSRYHINQGDVFVAAYDFLFENSLNGAVANMTILQTFEFSPLTNRIVNADFNILRYADFLDELQVFDFFTPAIAEIGLLGPLCDTAVKHCSTPDLLQYANKTSCMEFLRSVPLFDKDHVASNSVACRFVHSGMVSFAPKIHCPHIGPSGGGACVDQNYTAYFGVFPPTAFKP